MSNQLVVISDLHAHPWAAFAKGDGAQNSRLRQTLAVLEHSLAHADHFSLPWVFAGDLVHTAGYALNVVLSALRARLSLYPRVPKLLVWGNHDARGVGGPITLEQTALATLIHAVPELYVLDPSLQADPLQVGSLTFSGAGYQPATVLLRYGAPSDVGVYHQTVRGSRSPGGHVFEDGVDPEELTRRHGLGVVGHVHYPQWLGAARILVPGAPEHQNFGDGPEPYGWWVVELDGRVQFMPGGSPEFRTVETAEQVRGDGHYYRVLTAGGGAYLPDNALAVAPSPTVVTQRPLLGTADDAEGVLRAWLKEAPPPGDASRYLERGRSLLLTEEPRRLRPARLRDVFLTDFCCYVDQALEVEPGVWLVVGQGRDYPSNGAGKSTLFEALFWVLFGRTTKGLTGDEVVRRGASGCAVQATFEEADGTALRVLRQRGGSGAGLRVWSGVEEWQAAGTIELTDRLGRHLGLTPELFQALGYFSQERLLLFASATDGQRKDMLADLIGLEWYQKAATAAQRGLEAAREAVLGVGAAIAALEGQAAGQRAQQAEVQERFERWEVERAARAAQRHAALAAWDAGRGERALTLRTELFERMTGELRMREQRLLAAVPADAPSRTVAEGRVARARAQWTQVEAAAQGLRTLHAVADRECAVNRDARERADRAQAQVERALAAGACPTCAQPITAAHRERCVQPGRDEVIRLQQACERAEQARGSFAAELRAATARVQDAAREVTRCEAAAQAWQQLEELRASLAAVGPAVDEQVRLALEGERADLADALWRVQQEQNPDAAAVAGVAAMIARVDAELQDRRTERVAAEAEAVVLDYWVKGFGKQGIQSLLMDQVAGAFNAARGDIFPVLTQGVYDVQLTTLSRTKAGELRERTEFLVFERGEPVPYATLSGGQRRRVDVGVMLVLVKAVSGWMGTPGALGVLILDEVFGFLDAAGAEGLMEALLRVQEVVPAIYAVAHDPQLQALFPNVLRVVQGEDGTSVVEGQQVGPVVAAR